MAPTITNAVAISLLVLFVVVSIPAAIDTGSANSRQTYELTRNETVTVTQSLQATLQEASDTSANVTLRDVETAQSSTKTIPVDGTESYTLNNETVTVTVDNASNSTNTAGITVEYPRTYGWDEGTARIVDNFSLILVAMGAIVVLGMIMAVIK